MKKLLILLFVPTLLSGCLYTLSSAKLLSEQPAILVYDKVKFFPMSYKHQDKAANDLSIGQIYMDITKVDNESIPLKAGVSAWDNSITKIAVPAGERIITAKLTANRQTKADHIFRIAVDTASALTTGAGSNVAIQKRVVRDVEVTKTVSLRSGKTYKVIPHIDGKQAWHFEIKEK